MKKQFLLIILLCLICYSCSVVDELTKFDIDYQTNYTIPPVTIIDFPVSLSTPEIESESEATFESNNTKKDLVESIRLKSMVINILSPEDANFNFLKEIRIFIKSENVEETEIANLLDIENSNSKMLVLETLNKELAAYLKEDRFTLRVFVITDETTSQQIDISIDTIFAVDAKILGI